MGPCGANARPHLTAALISRRNLTPRAGCEDLGPLRSGVRLRLEVCGGPLPADSAAGSAIRVLDRLGHGPAAHSDSALSDSALSDSALSDSALSVTEARPARPDRLKSLPLRLQRCC
jgi:hypothetical protein